ncbi:hypothetical protein GCM10023322_52060 [Rugosimonospora acidiphila]|uniref:T4 beta protein n=1 Tax=Rugosimonospora acidiphila TaxID=556531 RepID=A0ABP9SA28_9ACTN
MVNYVPILKARKGELQALSRLAPSLGSLVTPIFEVSPSPDGPLENARQFNDKIVDFAPPGTRIGVDVNYLDDTPEDSGCPVSEIAGHLFNFQIPMAPVIHLSDSDRRLESHGDAARMNDGAFVRLGGISATDPDPDRAERDLPRIWNVTGLGPDQCDLLIDLAEVRSERDVGRAVPLARRMVQWAMPAGWRSIVVAAGAMPESLSGFPTNEATQSRRWDAELWQQVADLGVDYGDYSIGHPAMSANGRRPLPSLRYAANGAWWIYRWRRHETGGNDAFHDLCKALVTSEHWPGQGSEYSWGDGELAKCARRERGPGGATEWRAWGTSHHLAHVIDHLASSCEP